MGNKNLGLNVQLYKHEVSNCHYQIGAIENWNEDTEWSLKNEHQQSLEPLNLFIGWERLTNTWANFKLENRTTANPFQETSQNLSHDKRSYLSWNRCNKKKISFKTSTADSQPLWPHKFGLQPLSKTAQGPIHLPYQELSSTSTSNLTARSKFKPKSSTSNLPLRT